MWVNTLNPNIGQLGLMVRNVMMTFDVSPIEHYRSQKWCVDVHTIYYSKKLSVSFSLEISEGHTQDISKFRFHLLEPIIGI